MFVALTLESTEVIAAMLALLLGLFIPQMEILSSAHRWLLPTVSGSLALLFIIAGSWPSDFTSDHRKPNSLIYAFDSDNGKSTWASSDQAADEWTSQFLTKSPERARLSEYFPFSSFKFLMAEAPGTQALPPAAYLVDSHSNDDARTLRLRILSPRRAPVVSIYLDPNTEVLGAFVNNIAIDQGEKSEKGWALRYFALPEEGIDLTLTTRAGQSLRVRVVDQSYSLPDLTGLGLQPRPEYMMPALSPYTDATYVVRSFIF
jgi:hypothetical protein